MRNMTSEHFCPVCQEGVWYQFLARVSLIDDVEVDVEGTGSSGSATVTVNTIGLGQFRAALKPAAERSGSSAEETNGPLPGTMRTEREQIAFYGKERTEKLRVTWTQDGRERADLEDKFTFSEPLSAAAGEWKVNVKFETDEIRYDPEGLTRSELSFAVGAGAATAS